MNKIAFLLLSLVLGVLPVDAWAACSVVNMETYAPIPGNLGVFTLQGFTADVDANALVGDVIYRTPPRTEVKSPVPVLVQNCTSGMLMTRGTLGTPDASKVYPTNVSGIGVRFLGGVISTYTPWPDSYGPTTGLGFGRAFDMNIEFVKTGPITAGGTLTGEIGGAFFENGQTQGVSIRIGGAIIIAPKIPTCSVTTTDIAVPMGTVMLADFTGEGTSAGTPQNFKISLNCSGGDPGTSTNMYITLTDQTNSGNRSDLLSLTSASTATGVGIQILNGATPVSYGPASDAVGNPNQWPVREVLYSSGTTVVDIPLSAKYVQTEPTISAGTANGIATFTMSYQ